MVSQLIMLTYILMVRSSRWIQHNRLESRLDGVAVPAYLSRFASQ